MSESEDPKSKKYTPAHWDKLRASFQSSMLVDTRLSSLAESLDTESWPLKGKDETPAKYIDLSFEELEETQELAGHPHRIELLIDILDGTLAFDDPFGDMVQAEEASASEDNDVLKNLARLQIPPEYPISLTNLSKESLRLCENQQLKTLQEFADFSQNMAQHIVLAGDFRKLLNSLIYVDENTIATFLPFRPGSKGLHLAEAIGFAINNVETEERLALYRKYGGRLEEDEQGLAAKVPGQRVGEVEKDLKQQVRTLFEWFDKEREDLESMIHYGQSLDRFFIPINDPVRELIATRIVGDSLKKPAGPARPEAPAESKTPQGSAGGASEGLLDKVTGFFRKTAEFFRTLLRK